ncbi:FAD-dependent oxidoreductase [Sulfurospirillum sp. T05]|uniref:FAD-dependent oxidoreductase n=1 Tax=Sulfurospirillum tamanense TaxID=2813362 RepID=A0ABS2WQV5_9BACT|nr:FAD-dependent oxidoreductase [Sulfurospirillum tamanensis]MBN2963962.1 FAD-dependent oxidoreductase [Sulfurospirillum tamanensis]
MGQSVVIIGGGIAALTSAYTLANKGHRVTIINQTDTNSAPSFGNAGLLSAFEKAPLAAPGVITKTLKLMLQGKSPIVLRPNLDPHFYRWLVRFMASTTRARLKKTLILFERYGEQSIQAYHRLTQEEGLDFDFHHDGVMLVFTEAESYREKLRHATDSSKYEVLDYASAKERLGFVAPNIEGVIHLKRNGRLDPGRLMEQLKALLVRKGVCFVSGEEIVDFDVGPKQIKSARSKTRTYEADTFILASGHHTALAAKLGTPLMLIPAKGYNITFEMEESIKPKQCVMFNDLFIIATPRQHDMRLTSKLEIGTSNPDINMKRVQSILANLKTHTVKFELQNPRYWAGFRPLTPNDMPLIGRDSTYRNMVYGMGYGWLGMTFGPALGEIIGRLIDEDLENHQSDDVLLFSGFYQGCL